MEYDFDGYNYLVRLDKGQRLSVCFEKFASETRVEGAWVSGVGGVLEVTLGYYDLAKKEYSWKTYDGLREMAAVQGNIALDKKGQPIFHLHGIFCDHNYQTIGGHVKDFVAAATVEMFIHRIYKPLHRQFNPEVGLQTLDLT